MRRFRSGGGSRSRSPRCATRAGRASTGDDSLRNAVNVVAYVTALTEADKAAFGLCDSREWLRPPRHLAARLR
jgi:hypothetical protein